MLEILLIILLILMIGALPVWPYSRVWGYWPGSVLFIILIVLAIVMWSGTAAPP